MSPGIVHPPTSTHHHPLSPVAGYLGATRPRMHETHTEKILRQRQGVRETYISVPSKSVFQKIFLATPRRTSNSAIPTSHSPSPPSRSFRMRVVVVVAPCRPHLAVNHRHADRPHGRTPPSRNQVHVKSHCMKMSSSVFGCCARIRNSTGTETEDHIKTHRRTMRLLAILALHPRQLCIHSMRLLVFRSQPNTVGHTSN